MSWILNHEVQTLVHNALNFDTEFWTSWHCILNLTREILDSRHFVLNFEPSNSNFTSATFIILWNSSTHVLVRHTKNYDKLLILIRHFLCNHEHRWAGVDENATAFGIEKVKIVV